MNNKIFTNNSENEEELLEAGKIFPTVNYENTIYYIIFIISIIIWIILIFSFLSNFNYKQYKYEKYFIWIFCIIILYPIYIFISSIYSVYNHNYIMGLSPFFPICIKGYNALTSEEKKLDIVGKIDYKCWQNQHKFLFDSTNLISVRSHYLIRILFTLIVFLFGLGKVNTFQYKLIMQNKLFIKSVIRGAALCGIILISARFLVEDFNYLTIILNVFFGNLLHINIAILIILITYLLFNLFNQFF